MRYDKPTLATVGQAKGIVLGYVQNQELPDSFKDTPGVPRPGEAMGSRDGSLPPNDQPVG